MAGSPQIRAVSRFVHAPRRSAFFSCFSVYNPSRARTRDRFAALETMRGTVIEVPANSIRFDLTPVSVAGAPEHGQHTEEVLLDLGLSFEEIFEHKSRGTLL